MLTRNTDQPPILDVQRQGQPHTGKHLLTSTQHRRCVQKLNLVVMVPSSPSVGIFTSHTSIVVGTVNVNSERAGLVALSDPPVFVLLVAVSASNPCTTSCPLQLPGTAPISVQTSTHTGWDFNAGTNGTIMLELLVGYGLSRNGSGRQPPPLPL
jgi:hypothetical protein